MDSKDIEISFSYAHGNSIPQKQPECRHWDSSLINWAKKSYTESYGNNGTPHPIAAQFVIKKLAGLIKRPLMSAPDGKYNLNGCCIPAERKLFVSVGGKLHLCERIGKAPDIGNVKSGVDIERVRNTYIREYERKSLPTCSGCWALRLCDTCYVQAYYDGEFNIDYKNEYCWAQRLIALECLKLYCSLLETNEFGLDYLRDLVIR